MKLEELKKDYNSKKIGKFITFFFSKKSTRGYLYFQRKHDGKFFQHILPAEFENNEISKENENIIKKYFNKNFKDNLKEYEKSK